MAGASKIDENGVDTDKDDSDEDDNNNNDDDDDDEDDEDDEDEDEHDEDEDDDEDDGNKIQCGSNCSSLTCRCINSKNSKAAPVTPIASTPTRTSRNSGQLYAVSIFSLAVSKLSFTLSSVGLGMRKLSITQNDLTAKLEGLYPSKNNRLAYDLKHLREAIKESIQLGHTIFSETDMNQLLTAAFATREFKIALIAEILLRIPLPKI
jgi:hypothetical protein